LAGYRKE